MALKIKQILDLQTTLDAKALDAEALKIADNLSDLNDAATARWNLWLWSVAVADLIDADDFTWALSTNVASAESTKAYVDTVIAWLSAWLEYKWAFDASVETALPEDIKTWDFYKVSWAWTIDWLELAVWDMMIANKDKDWATAWTDFDKIDNTEAADILRDWDVSTNTDLSVDWTLLTDRATIKSYVDDAVAWVDSAAEISYDNSSATIITWTNVQDALDQLDSAVSSAAIDEVQEDFTNITTAAWDETVITLANDKNTWWAAVVNVNWMVLTLWERTWTEAANEIRFTTSYEIEDSDTISVHYSKV